MRTSGTARSATVSSSPTLPPQTPRRLSQYFHPVAASTEVGDQPTGATLLGEDLVLFRTSDGDVVVFKDLCIHRGTRLSMGEVTAEGNLRCPYHGWEYAATGDASKYRRYPRLRRSPGKARAFTHHAEERYGAVWVALEEPILPIPHFPYQEWDDPSWRGFLIDTQDWRSSAGRILENFCDMSHVPWVHPQAGGGDDLVLKPYDVWRRDGRLGYTVDDTEGAAEPPLSANRGRLEFVATMPFTAHLRSVATNDEITIISMTVAPLLPNLSRVFMWSTRNHHFGAEYDEERRRFAFEIMAQDQHIVESQRPEMIPLDLRQEMHVKVPDAFSIVYRRLLDEFGDDEPFLQVAERRRVRS